MTKGNNSIHTYTSPTDSNVHINIVTFISSVIFDS